MQGQRQPHPIALANVSRGVEVSAYEQKHAHGSRSQRRDSKLQARAHHVRAREGFGHVDAFSAVRCVTPQHGRGWVYFAGVIEPSKLIWLSLASFLIGCLVGFIAYYGEATWALVRMYG